MGFLDKYLTQPKPKGVKQLPDSIQAAPAGDEQAARYAEGALRSAADNIAFAAQGTRNHTLNAEAWSIGQLVEAGHIDGNTVLDQLWQAGVACGLPESEVASVIPRAMSQADARQVQLDPEYGTADAPDVGWTPTPAAGHPQPGGEDTDGGGDGLTYAGQEADAAEYAAQQKRAADIEREAYRLEVQDEAKKLAARETTRELIEQLQPPTPLEDFLAVEDPPITWVLEGLQPVGTRALLAAQAKAGKTTTVANLIKALADRETFLGDFRNHFDGTITLIDDELDDRMLRRWLRDINIHHPGKVKVHTLRGRLGDFNIVDDEVRHAWAAMLTGTDYLILDCLRPVLDANGLDENREAGIFLNAYDALLREAGIDSSLVVHHMGHGAARSRGDSRIMDWPDALWKLTRADPDEPASKRFFSAFGREVNVKQQPLHYREEGGVLVLNEDNGTRREKYATSPEAWVVQTLFLDTGNEPKGRTWLDGERKSDSDQGVYAPAREEMRQALKSLTDQDVLTTVSARGGAKYQLNLDSQEMVRLNVEGNPNGF